MDHRTVVDDGATDAELVRAALDGDRQAIARIYDRYADRVHTMGLHMLSDRDEASDVCGEVFLIAFQRLGQLRSPERLGSWLFAITRHEVYRRTKRRRRVDLIEGEEEMERIASTNALARGELDDPQPDVTLEAADTAGLATIVHAAAAGLDDRDRMVMELQLQGLAGDELAGALGTSTSTVVSTRAPDEGAPGALARRRPRCT